MGLIIIVKHTNTSSPFYQILTIEYCSCRYNIIQSSRTFHFSWLKSFSHQTTALHFPLLKTLTSTISFFFPGFVWVLWKVKNWKSLAMSCLILCDPMDCSSPDFSVHGMSQVRILDWVVICSSKGYFQPRDRTCTFCIGRATRENLS